MIMKAHTHLLPQSFMQELLIFSQWLAGTNITKSKLVTIENAFQYEIMDYTEPPLGPDGHDL